MHVGPILLLIDLTMTPDMFFSKFWFKNCILASMISKSTSCMSHDLFLQLDFSL